MKSSTLPELLPACSEFPEPEVLSQNQAQTQSLLSQWLQTGMLPETRQSRQPALQNICLHIPQMSLPQASDKLHCYYFPEEDS